MPGITDLGAQAAEGSQENDTQEYDLFDLETVDGYGRQHPASAIRGDTVALVSLPTQDGPSDRGGLAVILDNPELVVDDGLEDSVVVHDDTESGDDWKVVNLADDSTRGIGPTGPDADLTVDDADDMTGVDFDGRAFYGNVSQSFPEEMDRVAVKRSGGAGRSIVQTLDVKGDTPASEALTWDDDGNMDVVEVDDGGFPAHNGGFIEYDPQENGEIPRQARDPQLRPDVDGESTILMIQRLADVDPDYTGRAYWATVFANPDEARRDELAERYAEEDGSEPESYVADLDGDTFLRIEPTSEFEPDPALLEETGWVDFHGNTFDATDPEEVVTINQARLDNGQSNVFIPEGMEVAEAVPDDVTVDGDEITAFGQGSPDELMA